jgi:hypothetical protein
MLVHLEEVTGFYHEAFDIYRLAEIGHVYVGMRDAEMPVQSLKSGQPHLVDVADAAIRHCPDASERTMNVRIHFSPKRTQSGIRVEVVDYRDTGSGNALDVLPVLEYLSPAEALGRLGRNGAGACESGDRRQGRLQALKSRSEKALAARSYFEKFDRVGNRGRVVSSQDGKVEFGFRYHKAASVS